MQSFPPYLLVKESHKASLNSTDREISFNNPIIEVAVTFQGMQIQLFFWKNWGYFCSQSTIAIKRVLTFIYMNVMKNEKWTWRSFNRVWLFVTPWTVAHQAPLSVEFSRPEHWSGLPFPFPGDLPNPVIKPRSLTLQADSLPAELSRKPQRH